MLKLQNKIKNANGIFEKIDEDLSYVLKTAQWRGQEYIFKNCISRDEKANQKSK